MSSSFKVSDELSKRILDIIYGASWYFTCTGYQNSHDSDLSLDCHEIERDEVDEVVKGIVLEVLDEYTAKDMGNMQLKRIADALERQNRNNPKLKKILT